MAYAVSEKTMDFNDYRRVLDSNQSQTRPTYGVRSLNQQLFTACEDKLAPNSFYGKMVSLDSINTIPFGYDPLIKT